MRVTIFPHLRNTQGHTVEVDTLSELVREHRVVLKKDDAQLYSPTEFIDDVRSNKNAVALHFGVVDFDHLTEAQTMAVLEAAQASGYEFAFYTTFNHDPANGDWRFRIAVPFTRPVPAAQWTQVYWPRLASLFSLPGIAAQADPQCKDPARFYYEPSCPAARIDEATRWHQPGRPVDLTRVGDVPPQAGARFEQPALRKLTIDDLKAWQRKIRNRSSACAVSAGECIKHVLRGEAWGDKDTRNERLSNLCFELMKDFPTLDPTHVAQHFAQSCVLMQQQDAESAKYTPKYVEEKLREKPKYVAQRQQQYAAENQADYLRALQLNGFDKPYTPDEIAELEQLEVHPRGWVLQQESGAWIFTRKYGYRYFKGMGAAKNAAAQNLLPARPYGVRLERYDRTGDIKILPLDEIVQHFGSVPDRVVGSLVAQHTKYSSATRTLTIAECPLRALEPKFDPRVAEWLKLLSGGKHEQLLDWIAWASYLDKPCAMLVLAGETGVGKSLLVNGLARLWTDKEATPLVDALDNFNARLSQCPLLVADEKVPKDRDGKHRFDDLRELVTKRSFILNEKNVAKREVEGCVRIVVAVNSLSLLVGDTPESDQELKATLERIVHITPDPRTKDYLKKLRDAGQQWDDSTIAQHALWLRGERPLPAQAPRFLFEPETQIELANAFVASSAMYGAICQWLISFLREPRKLYNNITSARDPVWRVKVTENGFFATPHAIQSHWQVYGDKRPFQKSVQAAWVGFKDRRTTIDTPIGVKHTDAIDLDRLIAWAEEHTVSEREEIEELLVAYVTDEVYANAERALSNQTELGNGLRSIARPVVLKQN